MINFLIYIFDWFFLIDVKLNLSWMDMDFLFAVETSD